MITRLVDDLKLKSEKSVNLKNMSGGLQPLTGKKEETKLYDFGDDDTTTINNNDNNDNKIDNTNNNTKDHKENSDDSDEFNDFNLDDLLNEVDDAVGEDDILLSIPKKKKEPLKVLHYTTPHITPNHTSLLILHSLYTHTTS